MTVRPPVLARRGFISATTATLAASTGALQACGGRADSYDDAVRRIWRPAAGPIAGTAALHRELVRCATLAASSHNTQCWKFRLAERRISIEADLSRRCPAVDPDDHHLFVSLGCATENLIHAASAHGLRSDVRFQTAEGGVVSVGLQPARSVSSPLFDAIFKRQCTRAEYDGRPLPSGDLRLLERTGRGAGVNVLLLTERPRLEGVLEYVVRGNAAQMGDPAFIEELKRWIRFSDDEAVRTGDGLFSRSSGNAAAPRWLASPLFKLLFTAKNENDKYARQIRSSAGIAVFVSDVSDKAHWVETGRCYERFALQAAALGIRTALLNQPVEVSALRPQFASFLGIGRRRPDLVVRFGYGPELPRSLRRPLDAVIV